MRSELLSDAEWKIMNALWKRPHPACVRDVLDEMGGEASWAYTTVKTMLNRLADKGVLDVEKRANTSYYRPLLTRHRARRAAVRLLMDRAFDGALGPMMAFLVDDQTLSTQDRARLQALLDEELAEAVEEPSQKGNRG
jgi:BlaI family penicillinase repressor